MHDNKSDLDLKLKEGSKSVAGKRDVWDVSTCYLCDLTLDQRKTMEVWIDELYLYCIFLVQLIIQSSFTLQTIFTHLYTHNLSLYNVTGYTELYFLYRTHSLTDGRIGRQNGVKCLAQRHFSMWSGEALSLRRYHNRTLKTLTISVTVQLWSTLSTLSNLLTFPWWVHSSCQGFGRLTAGEQYTQSGFHNSISINCHGGFVQDTEDSADLHQHSINRGAIDSVQQ